MRGHVCEPPTVIHYFTSAQTESKSKPVPDAPDGALWRCPDCGHLFRAVAYSWAARTTLFDRITAKLRRL